MFGHKLKTLAATVVPALSILAAGDAYACAVCYGDPNSAMTKAMGSGIVVLLLCIGTVLSAFASLFLYWMYRARRLRPADEGATR